MQAKEHYKSVFDYIQFIPIKYDEDWNENEYMMLNRKLFFNASYIFIRTTEGKNLLIKDRNGLGALIDNFIKKYDEEFPQANILDMIDIRISNGEYVLLVNDNNPVIINCLDTMVKHIPLAFGLIPNDFQNDRNIKFALDYSPTFLRNIVHKKPEHYITSLAKLPYQPWYDELLRLHCMRDYINDSVLKKEINRIKLLNGWY